MSKTICLNMIVKNESHIIIKTLKNLTDKINFSYWVIGDNGSTDNTKELIKDFFNEKNIPGELYEDKWVDFGYNRTKALEKAYNKSDYVLIFDADDELCGDINIPYNSLTADGYHFNVISGVKYMRLSLVNNHKKWKYTGILHEYIEIATKGEIVKIEKLEGDYYIQSNRLGARSKNPDKYLYDAIILENGYNKAIREKDNISNRYVFYCANSYSSANKIDNAIKWYKKTLDHHGWIQERYVSCLNLYELYCKKNEPETGLYYLIKSYNYDKIRIETIYELIKYYCINGMNEIAYNYYNLIENYYENYKNVNFANDKLFLRLDNYSFFLPYYMIIISERMKKYDIGIKMYEIIFDCKYIDSGEWWIDNLIFNLQFFIDKVDKKNIEFINKYKIYFNLIQSKKYNLKNSHLLEKFNSIFKVIDIIHQDTNTLIEYTDLIQNLKKELIINNDLKDKYIICIKIYDEYEKNKLSEQGLNFLLQSLEYNKSQFESIYRLIKYYCIRKDHQKSYEYYTMIKDNYNSDNLFNYKEDELYFYLPYYMIIVCENIKKYDLCIKMYELIFTKMILDVNEWWIHNLFYNIQFIINSLSLELNNNFLDLMLEYINSLYKKNIKLNSDNYKIIDKIIEKYRPSLVKLENNNNNIIIKKNNSIKIMLTITTCKRFDLFEQTINSILKMWKDVDKIDYFYCVDDNSSIEDREKMKNIYPFFEYYFKSEEEKGHRESMNIIWNKLDEIKPTYWIHLEDDWLFFKSEKYITNAINILEKYQDQNVQQVVFNKHYGLMMSQMDINGGIVLEPGVILHEKTENITGRNCAYWPHYSLHPSVIRTSTILKLGNYNSSNSFFERDYAEKYYLNGYKTAFFSSIYSLHIGKQHWEKEGKNAYALNNIDQFKKLENKPSLDVQEKSTSIENLKDVQEKSTSIENLKDIQEKSTSIEKIITTNKTKNVQLYGTMKEHLEEIILKIKNGINFGLIRPSDGEYTILKGKTLTNCDNWTFDANKGDRIQKQLLTAIQIVDENLYIGIPCNTCNKPWNCTDIIYNDFINTFKVPIKQRTYANIFGNSNWKLFSDFMKSYKKGFYLITSGQTSTDELVIKDRFIISSLLVNNWNDIGDLETDRLLKFIKNKNNELICFSAGPISKIWIPICMKINPNNIYLDIGASLDIYTKGTTNRLYTDTNHNFSKELCIFKDAIVNKFKKNTKSKNLVYFCVFYNKDYFKLLNLLLKSLKFYSDDLQDIDFLIITHDSFKDKIYDLCNELNIYIDIKCFDFTTIFQAACARVFIFEYEHINSYEKILYLDTDILIKGQLSNIFNLEIQDLLYGIESGTINSLNFGSQFFDFKTIDSNKTGINSGTLLFKNTIIIKELFNKIINHLKEYTESKLPIPYCMDQPFINYHAIKDNLYNNSLLNPYISLYEDTDNVSNYLTSIICHFSFPIGNFKHKYERMIKYLHDILNINNNISDTNLLSNIINKEYSFNSGYIKFNNLNLETKWGMGKWEILDKDKIKIYWNNHYHIIKMQNNFNNFISIRTYPKDFDFIESSIKKQNNLYIYGDSHALYGFKNCKIPHNNLFEYSKTMYRIGRDNNIINFNISHNNYNNTFCFVYGEVDVRCHIGKQVLLNRDENAICNELVETYFKTIYNNIKEYKNIIIVGISPPTDYKDHAHNTHILPFIGTNNERVRYTHIMNTLLEKYCNKYNYIYFNPYKYYTRDDGCLKYELLDQCIHIGNNEYFLEEFYKLYNKYNKVIIIHKHKNKCGGIGDFIRAALSFYSICKRLNYDYYIDFEENQFMKECFDILKIPSDIDKKSSENITILDKYNSIDLIQPILNNINYNRKVYNIISNSIGIESKENINNIKTDFFNNIMKPSNKIINNINKIYLKNNIIENNYISVHIRCGDYNMSKNNSNDIRINLEDNKIYDNIFNLINNFKIINNINIPIIIHTDSIIFKNKMKEIYNEYIYLDIDIKHIAENIGNNSEEAYISTISEFYIISKASKILLLNNYSGFSHIASIINNVELHTNIESLYFNLLSTNLHKIEYKN